MSSEDWYRNKEWNSEIEEFFYMKLKRARTQRYQYIVIQALSLTDTHPDISLRLVDEYFETREDKYEDARALLARAKAYISQGKRKETVSAYQALLEREREFPQHQTTAYLDFPYYVVQNKLEFHYSEVQNILRDNAERLMFPRDYFIWHACNALIEQCSDHAVKALNSAKVEHSGFQYHQNVGLVGEEYKETIERLIDICT